MYNVSAWNGKLDSANVSEQNWENLGWCCSNDLTLLALQSAKGSGGRGEERVSESSLREASTIPVEIFIKTLLWVLCSASESATPRSCSSSHAFRAPAPAHEDISPPSFRTRGVFPLARAALRS